jgi:putative acetyltransferase
MRDILKMNDCKNVLIRKETPEDFATVGQLIDTAFKTAQVSNGKEAEFIARQRNSKGYIPELSFVAEQDGELVGQVILTRLYAGEHELLHLGPLAVTLECRRQGIGAKLMKCGIDAARQAGFKAIILCGDPQYYNRFGFKTAADFGLHFQGVPDQFCLAMELIPNALARANATLSEADL